MYRVDIKKRNKQELNNKIVCNWINKRKNVGGNAKGHLRLSLALLILRSWLILSTLLFAITLFDNHLSVIGQHNKYSNDYEL
ncbi:CLUMA_CG008789, isoform A [Clunio marinus]|uniref:CLUMA_CG008789, isoform A n=1 Tax=Clunio marinus TaxID=568069 RepID=A0A1J1I4R2_9DIPT|nr:CLUMA_CG008789, isoform A [Clunio marinus]